MGLYWFTLIIWLNRQKILKDLKYITPLNASDFQKTQAKKFFLAKQLCSISENIFYFTFEVCKLCLHRVLWCHVIICALHVLGNLQVIAMHMYPGTKKNSLHIYKHKLLNEALWESITSFFIFFRQLEFFPK